MATYQDSSQTNNAISQQQQRKQIVTFLAGLGLIILSCVSLIFLSACSSPPPAEPTIHNVVYELTGSEAATVNITFNNANGEPEQGVETDLPWVMEFDAPVGQLAYVSGQLITSNHQIKCIITIDGRRVQERASSGSNLTATCSARVQ
jgi:hypothetical protein